MGVSLSRASGDALLSSTVELEDILWGLYHFLDTHPTETLLLSLKVDHGTGSLPVQEAAHALITAPPVNDYWVQSTSVRAEGFQSVILLRRLIGHHVAPIKPRSSPS